MPHLPASNHSEVWLTVASASSSLPLSSSRAAGAMLDTFFSLHTKKPAHEPSTGELVSPRSHEQCQVQESTRVGDEVQGQDAALELEGVAGVQRRRVAHATAWSAPDRGLPSSGSGYTSTQHATCCPHTPWNTAWSS